jgi:hypothetical protein
LSGKNRNSVKNIRIYLLVLVSVVAGSYQHLNAQPEEPLKVRIELTGNQKIQGQLRIRKIPVILSVYTSDDDSIAVPTKIIRKITFEKEMKEVEKKVRFFNNTMIGIMTGRTSAQSSYRSQITAEMINGIRINTWCWAGLGMAFDQYPELSVMPVFFSLRGDMLKQAYTPFYFFDIGSGPSWLDENQFSEDMDSNAGLVFHFGGGLKVYADQHINIIIALGFKNQEVEITQTLWDGRQQVSDRNFKNFSFRIGVGF